MSIEAIKEMSVQLSDETDFSDIEKILAFNAEGATIRSNPCMAAVIGSAATDIYYVLVSKYASYFNNHKDILDKNNGAFPCTRADLYESVPYKKSTQNNALNELVSRSMVTVKGTNTRLIRLCEGHNIIANKLIYEGLLKMYETLPRDVFSASYGEYDISRPMSDYAHIELVAAGISQSHLLTTNRHMAHFIGLTNAQVYNLLMSLSAYANSEYGLFAPPISFLSARTGLSQRTIYNALKALEEYGLIQVGQQRRVGASHISLQKDVLLQAFVYALKQGMHISKLINDTRKAGTFSDSDIKEYTERLHESYMSKIQSIRDSNEEDAAQTNSPSLQKMDAPLQNLDAPLQNLDAPLQKMDAPLQNLDAPLQKTDAGLQKMDAGLQNLDALYNNIKKPYNEHCGNILSNPIYQQGVEEEQWQQPSVNDAIDTIDTYRQIVKENIEYDWFAENEDYHSYMEEIDEIVEIMVECICSNAETIRVAGQDCPQKVVKDRYLKLTSEHIIYVVDRLHSNTSEVRNIKAYLITTLYNAPLTISHYYTAMVNHDLPYLARPVGNKRKRKNDD